jgi:hypothetical protein
MAAGKKLKASEQVRQKLVALMTGKKLRASEQKVADVRIITTVWKTVEDSETAIKEANAARLARARYDQALTSHDPVVVCAMLSDIEDDGTAGAALLKAALQVLQAKKQYEPLHSTNEAKARKCAIKAQKYCKIADELGLNRQDDPYLAAEAVQAKLKKIDGKAPSVRTIARAFGAK